MLSYLPLMNAPDTTVIFDTDFCGDVDDVGALSLLCRASRRFGFSIGAVAVNVNAPGEAAAVTALLDALGFPDLCVGVFDGRLPDSGKTSRYVDALADRLTPERRSEVPHRTARDVYRSVLTEAKDGSVVVLSVGFFPNLDEVYHDDPELFLKKVRAVVAMAGGFGRQCAHREFNIEMMLTESTRFLADYKGPLFIRGFECGDRAMTDLRFVPERGQGIVTEAYRLFTDGSMLRPSWDPITTDFAIRGECEFYGLSEPGTVSVMPDATTRFTPNGNGNARHLVFGKSDDEIGRHISDQIIESILP